MANEPTVLSSSPSSEPVIVTIPDKFYGAALRATFDAKPKEKPARPAEGPAPKRAGWVLPVVIGLVVVAGVASGVAYGNRDLLFKKPEPVKPAPPPEPPNPTPPAVPDAAQNLTATATSPNVVSLTWTDIASNEAGYRLERRESTTPYVPLTSLPPNSSAFLDVSAQPSRSYLYRVIAMNAGGDSTPSNEATVATLALPPPPPEAPKLPPAGLDSDSDGLTDLEEPLYGTNPKDPDADKDSFLDGNEVFHLYNPAGKQGVTLLASNLVRVFESPVGWRVLAPMSWQVTLEPNGLKGTIATGHDETFTATVEDNPEQKSLLDWYLAKNPGVLSSQVAAIRTKSGYEGIEGADQLTVYFAWGSKVFVFKYNLNEQPFVNFRTSYEMMKNSLSLTATPNVPAAPAPSPSPEPEAPTTTPSVPEAATSTQ